MPLYRVHLHGKNLLIEMDGVIKKHGFYTHRDVTAEDAEDAESVAVQMLREHQSLGQWVKNPVNDPPIVDMEDLAEIEELSPTQPGLIWYPEESANRWWQFWRR